MSLLVVAGLWSGAAEAQQAGLQVQVVNGDSGAPLAGVTVTIENQATGFRRSAVTDSGGSIRLEALGTGGTYVVSVPPGGTFEAAAPAPVTLRSNYTQSVVVPLRPTGAGGQEVVVTGMRAITGINSLNAEVSASIRMDELARLPVEGRDVLGALVRLPNVVPSTGFFPEAPVISINGSNGLDTTYLIDGFDNNENFLGGPKFPVPLGFTREVTVLANSYSVAYGRTANGIVNFTSPSGGNELRGEVYALYRPGRPIDARSPFPRRDLSGNPVGESFRRFQSGFSVGGPIVRDRTFFYVNLEHTADRNRQLVDAPALGAVGSVTGRNRFLLGSARIDHRFNDAWSLTLRGNVGRVQVDRPGGGLGGGNVTFPSAGSVQERHSTLLAASLGYSGQIWSYDGALQFGRFRWNYAKPVGGPGPQVAVRDPSGLTVGILGNPGYVFDSIEKSWQTTHRLQREFGRHRLAAGIDLIRSDFGLFGGGNPDGNYLVDLTAAQLSELAGRAAGLDLGAGDILALNPVVGSYAVEVRPSSFGTAQNQLAFYLEDQWRVTRSLTATFGLRWDYDSLTAKGGRGGDVDNVAPRFSLNYRPTSRSAVRFGAGLFHGKLPYAVISDALQRNSRSPGLLAQLVALQQRGIIGRDAKLSELTFGGNIVASVACPTVSECPSAEEVRALGDSVSVNEARILNPDGYRSPRSLQLSGGYQVQLPNRVTLSADLLYSRTRNLVRLRDLNAPAPFTPDLAALTPENIALLQAQPDNAARAALAETLGLVRSQAAADATRPVPLTPGGARQITVSETAGKSTYRALILQAVKPRGMDPYAFRLAYTLSKLSNDTDDINFRAANSNDFSAEWGPSANDRRHVISAVGYVYPAKGLTVSVAALVQSGQPIAYVPDVRIFGTQDLNGDGLSFGESYVGNSDRYPGVKRNSGRLPWSSTIDVGLRYDLRLQADRSIELSCDIFNIFNTNNESGFANAATTSNQVQFGDGAPFVQRNAGPPRQVQFGAAFRF